MNKFIPIDEINALGFDVYYREPDLPYQNITYCYYTDGVNIGYLQLDKLRGLCISTVHKPCYNVGTAFAVSESSDASESSLRLGFMHCPDWATGTQRKSVHKYKNWDEFFNSSKFNQALKKYEKENNQ